MSIPSKREIAIGQIVDIIQKHHQRTGELTRGAVSSVLTKSASHPHGIKVALDSGEVGRVQEIVED